MISMNKFAMLSKIKELYDNNNNIMQYFHNMKDKKANDVEEILISYDFQAGSYTKYHNNNVEIRDKYISEIADAINQCGNIYSILEAGVGEATTIVNVVKKLNNKPKKAFGFDLSFSRIKYANKYAKNNGNDDLELFVGNMFNMPLKDSSIDVVFTSHAIEPNGGKEKEVLSELYRVANKYLVLVEPAYEFANDEAKERMIKNGYAVNLFNSVKELGYDVINYSLLENTLNPLNPSGLIIIKKNADETLENNPLCCPVTKSSIEKIKESYYSKDSMLVYPIVDGIPMLMSENAIVATKFLD